MKNETMRRMYKMMKPHKKTIIIVTILSIIINIGEIIRPYLIKVVIDDFLNLGIYEKGIITIGLIGGAYIGIVIMQNVIDFIVQVTTNMMSEQIVYSLRNKLYRYIEYANISFHDKSSSGKLFVRIVSDVEDIALFFKDVVTTIFKDVLIIIALIGIMIYMSGKLSLFSFIVIPLVIFISGVITLCINKLSEHAKNVKTKVNTFLAESIYGVKLIKIFSRQYEKQKECENLTNEFWKSRLPIGALEGLLVAFMIILENLAISIIVWACINHWLGIELEVGVIYMFITYIKQLFEPINRIIENVETVQEAVVSVEKVYSIIEQKEYLENFEDGKILKEVKGKIEFKNVWFAYEKDNWVLEDVSFIIEPGQSIALVGKTGSGKTTITNLINRFYEVQKGEILLDGVNIKDINIRSLRKSIGVILQDPFIFAKSIKDNIRLNESLSDEDIIESIKLASAEEFINGLPNGINEISNERGNSYSAGEKQLIAFARIFAHNPAIFILDEATANIDTHTEQLIQSSINKISKSKTSIFIAHRLATIINVDKIIVLDGGKIIEQGSHLELLKTDGYYSKLYNSYYSSLAGEF